MWRVQMSLDGNYTERKYPERWLAERAVNEALKSRATKHGKRYLWSIPFGWTAITKANRHGTS